MSKYQVMSSGDTIPDLFEIYGMETSENKRLQTAESLEDYTEQMNHIGHSTLDEALKDAKTILTEAPELKFVVIFCDGKLSQVVTA